MMLSVQKMHIPMVTCKNSHRHIWLINWYIFIKMRLIYIYQVFQLTKSVQKSNCESVKTFFCQFASEIFCPNDQFLLHHWPLKCHYNLQEKKEYQSTAAIFRYVPGKTIITCCSDLILHKIQVKYQNIWILRKDTSIQHHLVHATELI